MLYVVGMMLVLMCAAAVWSRARVRTVPLPSVQIDELGIRRLDGSNESVAWSDLVQIEIMTTDEGPFVQDVFWLFVSHDGTGCALPSSVVGDALWRRLERLPGVDFEAVLRAMGSTDNASFRVWQGARGDAASAAQAS